MLNPTVAIPTFWTLIWWLSPSFPPVQSIVTLPVAKILWSSALFKRICVVIPDVVSASVVIPTASGAISIISASVHKVGAAGTQLLAGASVNFSWGK